MLETLSELSLGKLALCICRKYSKTSDNGHSDNRTTSHNGQTACHLPLTVHTFLPPTKGQPPNNGQNAHPHRVHYSEVPLYTIDNQQ